MLDLSPDKLLMLAAVALVVLGPSRLPEAARSLGRFIGQMRAMSSSLQTEVRDALHDPDEALRSVANFRPSDVRRTVRRAVSDTLAPSAPNSGGTGGTGGDAGAAASAGAHPVAAEATNLPAGSASGPSAAGPSAVAGPGAHPEGPGWGYPAAPDDPHLN